MASEIRPQGGGDGERSLLWSETNVYGAFLSHERYPQIIQVIRQFSY